jgi:hypothetical protein
MHLVTTNHGLCHLQYKSGIFGTSLDILFPKAPTRNVSQITEFPWDQKVNKAFWRGTRWCDGRPVPVVKCSRYVHFCIKSYMNTYGLLHARVHGHARAHARTRTHTRAHTHTHTHTHKHMHMHAHTCTHAHMLSLCVCTPVTVHAARSEHKGQPSMGAQHATSPTFATMTSVAGSTCGTSHSKQTSATCLTSGTLEAVQTPQI